MVDWSLARQIARLAAGQGSEDPPPFDAAALSAEMEGSVAGYTGLALSTPTPPVEVVSRAEWASANLVSLSQILDPVAARLDDRLGFAGPLAGALRVGASATVAAEAGLVMGYLSSRVLGQYDVSLLGGDADPRLLFVGQNLAGAVRDLDVDADSVRSLDLRARAHARVPVPGRALAARAHGRPAAPLRGDLGGPDPERLGGRAAVAARSGSFGRGVPGGWARCARAESRTAGIDG